VCPNLEVFGNFWDIKILKKAILKTFELVDNFSQLRFSDSEQEKR